MRSEQKQNRRGVGVPRETAGGVEWEQWQYWLTFMVWACRLGELIATPLTLFTFHVKGRRQLWQTEPDFSSAASGG